MNANIILYPLYFVGVMAAIIWFGLRVQRYLLEKKIEHNPTLKNL